MKIVEICCGGYYDALNAYKGGAKRIELNSALHLGGLTPSLASLILTKQNTDLKVICMIRPRGAGFNYSEEDYLVMKEDCRILMENGADGIAFGFLNDDYTINIERTKEIVGIIKSYNGEAVFHRAFDCTKDAYKSIELLIELGVDRVLTSGQKDKAMDGKDLIKELQSRYGDQIEILAGSGINKSNTLEMMDYTGISQVHSSCKDWKEDVTTTGESVSYRYTDYDQYDVVSEALVDELVSLVE